VQEIKTKGYENAAALLGGYGAWERAGLPVERTQDKQ
jgi:rhodanese-related sulfurtransferase